MVLTPGQLAALATVGTGTEAIPSVMRSVVIDMASGHGWLLIEHDGKDAFRLTERGRVYLNALCDLPLPQQRWVIPTTGEGK